MKPHKRYSYWIFLVVIACASITEALPFLKDQVSPKVYGFLALAGILFQHIKQEIKKDEGK